MGWTLDQVGRYAGFDRSKTDTKTAQERVAVLETR